MTELNSLPESTADIETEFLLYEDSTARVVVETFEGGRVVSVSMYVEDHGEFPEIVPDDMHDCGRHESGEPSTVEELPGVYESLFVAASDAVKERFAVSRQYTSTGLGLCTSCLPVDGQCGTLRFVEFFN